MLWEPFGGTSAGAPHVAAIAALLVERNPTLTSEALRAFLTNTAVDLGQPGFDFTFGFGQADASAGVQAVPPVGAIALNASGLPGSRSVSVGSAATAFATIPARGTGTATRCSITPITTLVHTTFV